MKNEQEGWVNPSPNEPLVPSTCRSLPAALYARKELLKDVSRKLSKINDLTLGHAEIRALNDELNRQVRRIHEWDGRLRELGHRERDKSVKWGDETLPEPGNVHGYLYFGRAKELPGVKELLNPRKEGKIKLPARIQEMERTADAEYFGVDDEQAEMARMEREREVEERLCASEVPLIDWVTGLPTILPPLPMELPPPADLPAIPTATQVEQFLMEKKRQELLRKYVGK